MGGFVGLRLASRVPERIKTLVTLATKLDWTEESCVKEAGNLNADKIEAKVPKYAAALDGLHTQNGWRKVVDGTKAFIEVMSHYQLTNEIYTGIQTPVRLLLGDRDKMVGIDETIAAYRTLPNGELGVLPNTPHPMENVDLLMLTDMILSKVYKK
jgi:pimeloyl-ACP methyl ester carboxylesterase